MPNLADFETESDWMAACVPERKEEGDGQDQAVAACLSMWREREGKAMDKADGARGGGIDNALKAIKRTPYELTVGNYIVLFGNSRVRDLEGIGSPNVNADGTTGEYFTKSTILDSDQTKAGLLGVDWEHQQGEAGDDVLGVVDWKTAKVDDRGVFVERVLSRRNQYVQWLEELGWFDDGTLGTSSQADPEGVEKAADGQITRWPLVRDTITVQPMEPRMIAENQLRALKALGLMADEGGKMHVQFTEAETVWQSRELSTEDKTHRDAFVKLANEPKPEAAPEANKAAQDAERARLRLELELLSLEGQWTENS